MTLVLALLLIKALAINLSPYANWPEYLGSLLYTLLLITHITQFAFPFVLVAVVIFEGALMCYVLEIEHNEKKSESCD